MGRPAALPAPPTDDYQDAMALIDLANPTSFLSLDRRACCRGLSGATAIAVRGRPLSASALAPDDYQQGADRRRSCSSTCRTPWLGDVRLGA